MVNPKYQTKQVVKSNTPKRRNRTKFKHGLTHSKLRIGQSGEPRTADEVRPSDSYRATRDRLIQRGLWSELEHLQEQPAVPVVVIVKPSR